MPAEPLVEEDIRCRVDKIPRHHLAVLPTGLQELPRLGRVLQVPNLCVKRDDLTGLALGGNKTRGLEFILADATSKGCDVLVAGGGVEQSNHAVQCVAAANKVGLDSVMVLRSREPGRPNGNALLHELLGGKTVWVEGDPAIQDRVSLAAPMQEVADKLRCAGREPYVLESSLHPLSVIAYVNVVLELRAQLAGSDCRVYITSEGAALGGLLLGTKLLQLPWSVYGLGWRPAEFGMSSRLLEVTREAARLLGVKSPLRLEDIVIGDTGGPAYGVGSSSSWNALLQAARLEGLVLDPVYTAKGMSGMMAHLSKAPVPAGTKVVFVHTGGIGALFAYAAEIEQEVLNHEAAAGAQVDCPR